MIAILQVNIAPFGLAPMGVFPFLMGAFLILRTDRTTSVMRSRDEAERELVYHVNRAARNFPLLRDFNHRGKLVERFEKAIASFNRGDVAACAVATNNIYFALWISDILVGLYMLLGGYYLISQNSVFAWMGEATLGVFLTTVNVFQMLGCSFRGIYEALVEIQSTFPALTNIVTLI